MSKKTMKIGNNAILTGDYDEFLIDILKDPKEAKAYLNAALEDEDYRVFLLALRDIADAFGISHLASISELNRENIYRMLSTEGNPKLSSIVALLRAIGVRLQAEIVDAEEIQVARDYTKVEEKTYSIEASITRNNFGSYPESDFAKRNRLFRKAAPAPDAICEFASAA